MSHSFNKIWIHAIWSTKDRSPLIDPKVDSLIFEYMNKQFVNEGCPVRIINGTSDHVHCLFLLNPTKSIADIIKQVKGSTAHFINEQNIITAKFSWQTGYGSFSVSESVVNKVFEYIKNQKQHHAKKSFQEEYNDFLKLYGFSN